MTRNSESLETNIILKSAKLEVDIMGQTALFSAVFVWYNTNGENGTGSLF